MDIKINFRLTKGRHIFGILWRLPQNLASKYCLSKVTEHCQSPLVSIWIQKESGSNPVLQGLPWIPYQMLVHDSQQSLFCNHMASFLKQYRNRAIICLWNCCPKPNVDLTFKLTLDRFCSRKISRKKGILLTLFRGLMNWRRIYGIVHTAGHPFIQKYATSTPESQASF